LFSPSLGFRIFIPATHRPAWPPNERKGRGLPAFLNNLRIENLGIDATRVTLDFKREGERTHMLQLADFLQNSPTR
jgi:hypothetical protein